MKTNKRTEFKDYVHPTGQTFWEKWDISWAGIGLVLVVIGLIWLMAWGALNNMLPTGQTDKSKNHAIHGEAQ